MKSEETKTEDRILGRPLRMRRTQKGQDKRRARTDSPGGWTGDRKAR